MGRVFKTNNETNKKRKKEIQKSKKLIMKEQDSTKLEFLLKVNGNIIVQRFFNVRGYNHKARNSMELHDYISEFIDGFRNDLRIRTASYMLDNMYDIYENPQIMETSITDGPESFSLMIKNGDNVLYNRYLDAKIYPPKVRYTVDLRPKLKSILNTLTEIFSTKKLTLEYSDYSLDV